MGLEKIGINAAKSGVAFLKSGYNKYLLYPDFKKRCGVFEIWVQ